ncbi:hypothetical protein ACHAPU_011443 [Fusarium lateritium]
MQEIKVEDYLFRRLHSLGIHCVFGVPGDYSTKALGGVDAVIWIGNYLSDFNTGEFITVVNKDPTVVNVQRLNFSIGKTQYTALSSFFRPGDVVIGETSTSAFGPWGTKLPSGVNMLNQTVYGKGEGLWKRPVLVNGEGSMHLNYSLLGKTFGPAFEPKYHGPIKTCDELSELLSGHICDDAGCLEVRRSHEVFGRLANDDAAGGAHTSTP